MHCINQVVVRFILQQKHAAFSAVRRYNNKVTSAFDEQAVLEICKGSL